MSSHLKKIEYTDQLLSRGREKMLVIYDPKTGSLVKFGGGDIPGLAVITKYDYRKAGKWSAEKLEISIPLHCQTYVWQEDFDTGEWIQYRVWDEAYAWFLGRSGFEGLDFNVFKAFVRLNMTKKSIELDGVTAKIANLYCPELVQAQKEADEIKSRLAASIKEVEEEQAAAKRLEQEKAQAAEITKKTEAIRAKLQGRKMSLADMQELYKSL